MEATQIASTTDEEELSVVFSGVYLGTKVANMAEQRRNRYHPFGLVLNNRHHLRFQLVQDRGRNRKPRNKRKSASSFLNSFHDAANDLY